MTGIQTTENAKVWTDDIITLEWDAHKPAGHVCDKFTWPSSDCVSHQSTKPVFFLILLRQLTVLTSPSYVSVNPCSFRCCSWKFDQSMSVSPTFFLPLQVKDWSKLQTQCQPVFFLQLQLKIWSSDISVNPCSFCHCSWKFDPMMSVSTCVLSATAVESFTKAWPCQWQAGITICQPWCHVRQQKLCSFYHCSWKPGLQLPCHQGTPTATLEHCEIKNTSKRSSFFKNTAMVVIMFVFFFSFPFYSFKLPFSESS